MIGSFCMSIEGLRTKAKHLLSSIELLRSNMFIVPSLILTYSTIDIMAWLDRDEDHSNVTRADFIAWVEDYLLPNSELGCSALDLYAARCSLLHSYAAESSLSRAGEARELFYAWGVASDEDLQVLADTIDSSPLAIQVEELLNALRDAVKDFISKNRENQIVIRRSTKLFANLPMRPRTDLGKTVNRSGT